MSLVYNNKKLIGKCSKFSIEKVQGTSPFVMLENFEPKQPQLNENQQIVLDWLKKNYFDSYFKAVISNLFFFIRHDDIDGFPNETSHKMVEAYGQLSNKEFAKVLEVFSRWVQEQEAE